MEQGTQDRSQKMGHGELVTSTEDQAQEAAMTAGKGHVGKPKWNCAKNKQSVCYHHHPFLSGSHSLYNPESAVDGPWSLVDGEPLCRPQTSLSQLHIHLLCGQQSTPFLTSPPCYPQILLHLVGRRMLLHAVCLRRLSWSHSPSSDLTTSNFPHLYTVSQCPWQQSRLLCWGPSMLPSNVSNPIPPPLSLVFLPGFTRLPSPRPSSGNRHLHLVLLTAKPDIVEKSVIVNQVK